MKYYTLPCEVKHNGVRYTAGSEIPASDADAIFFEGIGGTCVRDDGSVKVTETISETEEFVDLPEIEKETKKTEKTDAEAPAAPKKRGRKPKKK